METETIDRPALKFLGTFELGKKEEPKAEPRLINIKKIAFSYLGSDNPEAIIEYSENTLHGRVTAKFKTREYSKLFDSVSNLIPTVVNFAELKDAWYRADITNLEIYSYSEELAEAIVLPKLKVSIPNGDSYKALACETSGVVVELEDIKPIVEEAIALILSKPKYEQINLLGDGND